ncbi:hypothetical protein MCUN1_003747 [Malassezia cuniculi]|uniref:PH domain-containing protein n=1 Tax=Malassezia cuniculi TaxID=948313 RepID=A0AAF0EY39_9BASI|nr:hypothetical protein MCUN1_003747 [Malassezia cuniculi]
MDPRGVWADVHDVDMPPMRERAMSLTSTINHGTPVIDSNKWFGRKAPPPPLLSLNGKTIASHDSSSSTQPTAHHRIPSRRITSMRAFSYSDWSGKSTRSASPVPAPLDAQWLSPELQASLEQQVGEVIAGRCWIGQTFEVGARFWAQFDNVHEFGDLARLRSGSMGSARQRATSHSSGRPRALSSGSVRPPTIVEHAEPAEPITRQDKQVKKASDARKRIVSPFVSISPRKLAPGEVESRIGWDEVSNRINKISQVPRIRRTALNPGLKSILKQPSLPIATNTQSTEESAKEQPTVPEAESDSDPSDAGSTPEAYTPLSSSPKLQASTVSHTQPPPLPPKSLDRPPSIKGVYFAHPASESSSDADHESLESIPAEETEQILVESPGASDSDLELASRALSRTRSLFTNVAPAARQRHVTFAPRSEAQSLKTLDTASASSVRVDGQELASAIAARGRPVPVGRGDKAPAPAGAVLAREDTPPLPDHSVDWAHQIAQEEACHGMPILKRDRMLIKVQTTAHTDLPQHFDEFEARRLEIRSYHWAEYMVVLRSGHLELWSEASIRGRLFGDVEKLKRRHVIKLDPHTVSLSLYSSVDSLFCLTLPRRSILSDLNNGRFNFLRSGSYIFIFNARMNTLASDWLWMLWRELGGNIPNHIFVHLPSLSMRVRMPVPHFPNDDEVREYAPTMQELGTMVSKSADEFSSMMSGEIIEQVVGLVYKLKHWAQMIEHSRWTGMSPKLVWRCGNAFNWVTDDYAADGTSRFWSVLVGEMMATHKHVSELELILNWHYPSEARKPDGNVIHEPAAVEGFVWRLRPVSGTVQRVYLTVHDSFVFMCRPALAFTPDEFSGVTPDLSKEQRVPSRKEYVNDRSKAFRTAEKARCERQIRHSEGFVDLCDVEVVRSVGTKVFLYTSSSRANINMLRNALRRSTDAKHIEDFATQALDDSLCDDPKAVAAHLNFPETYCMAGFNQQAPDLDQSYVRSLRQFELVLGNGRAVSFECLSPALARDWIVHLYLLARYWRCRRRIDAWNIMSITGTSSALKPEQEQLVDQRMVLAELWNWCRIDGCRSIVHSGLLYMRRGTASLYRQRFLVIVGGRLVIFKVVHSTRSRIARQNEGILFKRVGSSFSLRDAYVYQARVGDRPTDMNRSAKQEANRRGSRTNAAKTMPRLYSHGLYSSDSQDDCTFVVRVRLGYDSLSARQNAFRLRHSRSKREEDLIPGLADKAHGELVFRTRTSVERDIWIRSIMFEIERLGRREAAREECVRNRGHVD